MSTKYRYKKNLIETYGSCVGQYWHEYKVVIIKKTNPEIRLNGGKK